MSLPSLSFAIAALCGSIVIYLLALLYRARSEFYYSKVVKGLPMPPWNPIFGHLLTLDSAFKSHNLPPDIQMPDVFSLLSKEFSEESDSLFYMDLWPFTEPMMMVSSPNYAIQTCQQAAFATDRPDDLLRSMHAITGGPSIFATNGVAWREARNVLSSGFNSGNIRSQTAHVVDAAEVLVKILKEKTLKDDLFQLDTITIRYMMDISGAVTL